MTDIKKLRHQAKISQRELALASGLSDKAVRYIENGIVQPSLSHWYKLQRICRYGVKSEEFREFRFNGNVLVSLRAEVGINQKELEKKLLLPATIVSAWETGKKIPSVKALEKLCVYFGVRPDYFFEEMSNEA